jgi:hypothetical protein
MQNTITKASNLRLQLGQANLCWFADAKPVRCWRQIGTMYATSTVKGPFMQLSHSTHYLAGKQAVK